MLNLIPLPYRILGAFVVALAMIASGFAWGAKTVADRAAARQLDAERAAAAKYRAEVERGNALSAQLATAETQIRTINAEKIRYVPQVTTGKPCLDPAAVRLLNSGPDGLSEATGEPNAEDAGGTAATDADTLAWGINAKAQYSICAKRVNALVDYENGRE